MGETAQVKKSKILHVELSLKQLISMTDIDLGRFGKLVFFYLTIVTGFASELLS